MKYNVYIAGGWFTPKQLKAVEEMESAVRNSGMYMYSPRTDCLWKPGMDEKLVVSENMDNIDECSFVLASTEGKDMGTLFECGYAYARGVPVVYYFKSEEKFNIMLAGTGEAVIQNQLDLNAYLEVVKKKGLLHVNYDGPMQ
jgi:nucleoside 2-deoxyribosyltransferase